MSEMNGRRLIARWWVKIPQLMGTVVHPIISHYWQRFIHPDSRSLLSQQICRCLPIYIYIYHMYTCPLATVMGLRWCTPHARDQTVKGQEAEGRGVPELFSARRCKFGTPKILRITGGGVVEGVVLGGGSGSCIPMMYGWWFLYVFVTSMDDSGGTKWKWFSMVVIVWLMFL